MTFDMDDFIGRTKAMLKRLDRSPATLSKRLFGNPSALPRILSGDGSARFDTLLKAEERLSQLEAELDAEAA